MTEITDNAVQLPIAVQQFVLHWGEMGGQWGVNRSVAQIHALLYLSDRPLNAEEISDTLRIARSNTSNSLKELLGWKLIRRVPVMGDRRDHYEAEVDLMQMLTRIAQGRKEREIDPAVAALRVCTEEARHDGHISDVARGRIGFRRHDRRLVPADDERAAGTADDADPAGQADPELPSQGQG